MTHPFLLPVAFIFVAFCSSVVAAQESELMLRTPNPSFEEGLGAWGLQSPFLQVERVVRNWAPDASEPAERDLGQWLVKASGFGGWGREILLNASSTRQVISIQAYVESQSGGPGGWCGFGITYFDSNGNVLDEALERIGGPSGSQRGLGDGLVPYSVGGIAPLGTAYAHVWMWSGEFTNVVYFDEFSCHDYQPSTTNLLATGFDLYQQEYPSTLVGDEFFYAASESDRVGIQATTIFVPGLKGLPGRDVDTIAFGRSDAETIAYQPLQLEAGRRYELVYAWQRSPGAFLGVDYYDSNGVKVGEVVAEAPFGSNNPFTGTPRFTVELPAGASYGVFWIYVPPHDTFAFTPRLLLLNATN